MSLEQPQTKRTRRPSVRLGEIGELGFTASWLDSRSNRKLQQLQEHKLQQLQEQEQKQQEQKQEQQEQEQEQEQEREQHEHQEQEEEEEQEEEWSVVEVAVGGGSPVVHPPASTATGKRRSGGGRVRRTGIIAHGRQEGDDVPATARSEPQRLDQEDEDGLGFRTAVMSSDSDGRGLMNNFGIGANPNSHGEEMQGAIEDAPDGRGFRTGERRSGRPGGRRKHRVPVRETVSRDTTSAEAPVVAAPVVANGGTMVVTPSSRPLELQRITLSAGVSGWLQELGLGKYAELFELNEVDTEVLPLLTLDDLREMGVDAVGARRKMFTNIEALRGV